MRIPDPLWGKSPDDALKLARKIACFYASGIGECDPPASLNAIRFRKGVFVMPQWIEDLPDEEDQQRARLRFSVWVAALYATPEGTLSALARVVGLNPRALSTYTCPGAGRLQVSAKIARRIHKACGGVVSRSVLCPDTFGDGDDD